MKKGNDRYSWSGENTFTPSAARTIIFHRENLNYLTVCFTLCISFFSIRLFSILGFHSREKAETKRETFLYRKSRIWEMKEKNMQKALPIIRSMQQFICDIFTQIYKALNGETPCLCPFQWHKYGRRKPTDPSVFEFSYLCLNSKLEELIKIKAIFILRQGMLR